MLRSTLRPIARTIASGSRRYASGSSNASSSMSRNRTLAIAGTTALVLAGYVSQKPSLRSDSRVQKPALDQDSLKNSSINADDSKAGSSQTLERVQKASDSKEAQSQKSGTASGKSSTKPKAKSQETSVAPAGELIEKKSEEAEETMQEGGAETQGAFNEETGEINWDCPCLGGMADGPCGEEFKAAFSCFVYSDKEPKGIECIDAFKSMQDCFRRHPDIYGEEIDDMEEDGPQTPPEDEKDVPPTKKLPLEEKR